MWAPDLAIGRPYRAILTAGGDALSIMALGAGVAIPGARPIPGGVMMQGVYFVRARHKVFVGGRDMVKIGYSTNIHRRLQELGTYNGKLELLGFVPPDFVGGERNCHQYFKRFHVHGEWFRWCPEMAEEIDCILAGMRICLPLNYIETKPDVETKDFLDRWWEKYSQRNTMQDMVRP